MSPEQARWRSLCSGGLWSAPNHSPPPSRRYAPPTRSQNRSPRECDALQATRDASLGKIIMAQPSRLSALSNALKIADKVTISIEAVGSKIRVNCHGWEDARVLTERQALMVVAIDGRLYLLPEHRPAKFEHVDLQGLNEAGYGEEDFA
jgi:hypothetical protein